LPLLGLKRENSCCEPRLSADAWISISMVPVLTVKNSQTWAV
jgi:hypothetical protein